MPKVISSLLQKPSIPPINHRRTSMVSNLSLLIKTERCLHVLLTAHHPNGCAREPLYNRLYRFKISKYTILTLCQQAFFHSIDIAVLLLPARELRNSAKMTALSSWRSGSISTIVGYVISVGAILVTPVPRNPLLLIECHLSPVVFRRTLHTFSRAPGFVRKWIETLRSP